RRHFHSLYDLRGWNIDYGNFLRVFLFQVITRVKDHEFAGETDNFERQMADFDLLSGGRDAPTRRYLYFAGDAGARLRLCFADVLQNFVVRRVACKLPEFAI